MWPRGCVSKGKVRNSLEGVEGHEGCYIWGAEHRARSSKKRWRHPWATPWATSWHLDVTWQIMENCEEKEGVVKERNAVVKFGA